MNGSEIVGHEVLRKVIHLHPLDRFTVTREFPTAVYAWMSMMVVFHFVCILAEIFDRKQIFAQCRRQPPGDNLTYFEMLPRVLSNQVFIMLPAMLLAQRYGLAFRNLQLFNSLPSFVAGLAIMSIGHDVVFYFGHRFLLHSKHGYMFFGHNVHHSTKANSALSSFYMANLDFCFEIVLPYLLPLMCLGDEACILFNIISLTMGVIGGAYEHSGYQFLPSVEFFSTTAHHLHHKLGFVSFSDGVGSPNLMDNLFETSHSHYLKSHRSKRII